MAINEKTEFFLAAALAMAILGPRPLAGQEKLTLGQALPFSRSGAGYTCLPPGATCYFGIDTFTVDVPQDAKRLDVTVTVDATTPHLTGAIVYGSTIAFDNGYKGTIMGSADPSVPMIYTRVVTNDSTTTLKAGTWSIGLYTQLPFGFASGSIIATVSSAPVPYVSDSTAVRNAASFFYDEHYTLGVAPGEIVCLFGGGLGPSPGAAATPADGSYPFSVATTKVWFDGLAAPVLYSSDGQINAIVPYGLASTKRSAGDTVAVKVEYNGSDSPITNIGYYGGDPGIFTSTGTGTGQAAALNEDMTLNSATNPAKAGSIIVLYATGEGQTVPAGVDGRVNVTVLPQPVQPVIVRIDGVTAELKYAAAAPGQVSGLMQINAVIPTSTRTGNAVPVALIAGGHVSMQTVTIAVSK